MRPKTQPAPDGAENIEINRYLQWLLYVLELAAWIVFIISVIHYFQLGIKVNDSASEYNSWFGKFVHYLDRYQIVSKINFSEQFVNETGSKFIMIAVVFGYLNLLCCGIADFFANFSEFCDLLCTQNKRDTRNRINCIGIIVLCIVFIYRMLRYLLKITVGIFIFHASLIPFLHGIDHYHYAEQYIIPSTMMNYGKEWYMQTRQFHVVSSYGLFRRMTGVGGRPELEIFVSGDDKPAPFDEKHISSPPTELEPITAPWDEAGGDGERKKRGWYRVPFTYKPGDLDSIPGWIAPHQPRLDWQMWFAALGSYQHNPWFISFLYRLITPEQSGAIYDLIDEKRYIYSPHFIDHLKRKQQREEAQQKLNIMQRIMRNLFGDKEDDVDGTKDVNEFDGDYYKTKKRKKNKNKKKQKRKKEKNVADAWLEQMHYGFPKYIVAVLYDYHYTTIDDMESSQQSAMDSCTADQCPANGNTTDVNKGIWWRRERKREYFPVTKYTKLDSIRKWLKDNGFLKRPVFDGESEMSNIVKAIRSIRYFYRRVYHENYDVVALILALTVTVLLVRCVHEYVQRSGDPLSP